MIHESTKICWMDVKNGSVKHDTVDELFKKYSCLIKKDYHCETEYFKAAQLKITDLYGWTDVVHIRRYEFLGEHKWFQLKTSDDSVIVDAYTLIPVFNGDACEGFHGEVKYQYILHHPEMIKPDGKLRMKKGTDDIEFSTVTVTEYNGMPSNVGYEIVTKSRFFNANNIYMFGDEAVTMDEMISWTDNESVH